MSGQAVDAIVFDVGRVIVHWQLRHLFAKLIDDERELDWFLDNVVTEEWHFEHDAGRPLSEMLPERKAQFPQYARFIDAYAVRFLETIPGPVEGTADVIASLAKGGVSLYAITNFGAEFWQMFRPTCAVLDNFAQIIVSGEEKLAKPDPAIFELAAHRDGHSPDAMLFIDDNAANIASAAALGWHTHLFTDAATLRGDLKRRGLL